MKIAAKILLLIFITFLALPTIVRLIEKNTDVAVFYSFEEEAEKDLKEIKANLKQDFDCPFLNLETKKNNQIVFENLSGHDNIAQEINSPPPKLV
jgi:hypothetical protein